MTPVAIYTRGGRAALFSGLGVFALTLVPLEVIGNRIGGSSLVNAAFIASRALAAVLMLPGFIVAHKYAVVLTGRRLLVFRWSGMLASMDIPGKTARDAPLNHCRLAEL